MASNHNCISKYVLGVVFLLAMCLPHWAVAFDKDIVFERLTLSEGLSQSNVFAFHEDHIGYLWMATQSAADRFDGYGITSFRHDPANPNTLTSGSVTGFYQQSDEFLWISTEYGVSRFDFATQTITRVIEVEPRSNALFMSLPGSIEGVCQSQVLAVFSSSAFVIDTNTLTYEQIAFTDPKPQDNLAGVVSTPDGTLWLSDGSNLWASDCKDNRFVHVQTGDAFQELRSFGSSVLTQTTRGDVVFAGADGLQIIGRSNRELIGRIRPSEYGPYSNKILATVSDPLGGLWLFTPTELLRIVLDDDGTTPRRIEKHLSQSLDLNQLENRNGFYSVTGGDGLIWLAVNNMVGAYEPSTRNFRTFSHDPQDANSLPPTAGRSGYELHVDRFGVVWFGAKLGGVGRYVPQRHRFDHLRDPTKASYVVRGVAEQRINNASFIWVGLDDAGIQLWKDQGEGQYQQQPIEMISPDTMVVPTALRIRSMATHPITGSVWFNAATWFGQLDAKNQTIELIAQPPHPQRFGRNRALAFSPNGRFLYQSIGRTLIEHEFDNQGSRIESRSLDWLPAKINQFPIGAIAVLDNGTVLAVAENELFAITPWNQQVQHVHILDPQFRGARILSMLINGNEIMLGTRDYGLLQTELQISSDAAELIVQKQVSQSQGLPDVTIYAIARDASAKIWLSSNRGLSRVDPSTDQILNFSIEDGLQAYEFNAGVVHKTPLGKIYFGGINGINSFDPNTIDAHPLPPTTVLKRFEINEKSMGSSTVGPLRFDENNWVIEYLGIHSVAPQKNQFAYRLEGLNTDWVQAGSERIARYTGLSPGRYAFMVKSANGDGVWSEPKVLLEATIKPPPWMSPAAYIAYTVLIVLVAMGFVVRARQREIELQQLIDQRTQELKKKNELVVKQSTDLQDALNARTLFFANVSHELRTPLTLIDANLNTLDQAIPEQESVAIAKRYLKRLVRLVDQLLDLSKIRLHGVQTETTAWSIDALVGNTIKAYLGVASSKNIQLDFVHGGPWYTRADQASVEKILLNLLTNALKFTPNNGRVTIDLDADEKSGVWLRIKDTGPGISSEEQEVIFERFYRAPIQEAQRTSGAGIGLALVAEAVGAIGGTIELQSEVGTGSTFSVWLAATQEPETLGLHATQPNLNAPLTPDVDLELAVLAESQRQTEAQGKSQDNSLGTLLVVEDNEDLRDHLAQTLSDQWQVITATDGMDALEKLSQHEVDVILSDIMMPRMDGLSLLKKVRDVLETSHIPFLFLTARSDDETELQSLLLSADDFVTKPFDPKFLSLKLRNLWGNRQRLQRHLGLAVHQNADSNPKAIEPRALSPRDHRFVERLASAMDTHFQDPDLSVAGLASALAVDERTLQRKIKALYDQTPAYFINEYRIRHACELLENPALEIQEVAYQSGYGSGRYFSRVFSKHRNCSPSQWRQQRNHPNRSDG